MAFRLVLQGAWVSRRDDQTFLRHGELNCTPKDAHVLIPGTWDYIILTTEETVEDI